MVWIHAINESAAAEFAEGVLNPLHPDKFRTLGRRLRLRPGQRVLDIGAGRCGPAVILAREFGCHITAVEPYPAFMEDAQRRVEEAGLGALFDFVLSAGADFDVEPEAYDVAMCIGASFAFTDLEGTLHALAPAVRPKGHVVVGEVYWEPGQDSTEGDASVTLAVVLDQVESHGLDVVSVIRSTIDEFDQYHSVQTTSLLDWLEVNSDHEDADQVRRWRREAVERFGLKPFGWALVAGRKS